MKYLIALLLVSISGPAFANVEGSASAGGSMAVHGTESETTTLDVIDSSGPWEGVYSFNNAFQRTKGVTSINLIDGEIKENYNLKPKLYVISDFRYDYNEFRPWQNTGVIATGFGYRLIHTKKLKISDEVTLGIRITDLGKYPVIRDSLWIRLDTGKLQAYSKLLYEKSNISYYQEQSGIDFKVTKLLTFGIKDIYSKDIKLNHITSFNIGVKF